MEETRSPRSPAPAKVFHYTCFAMNTRFSMVLVGVDAERAEALAQAAQRDLRAHERLMSRFDAESPVSDLNRRAAEEPWNRLRSFGRFCRCAGTIGGEPAERSTLRSGP